MNLDDTWLRLVDNLTDRVSGPMKFRLVLQPLVASSYAVMAGIKDAKAGKPAYFWAMLTDKANRLDMAKDGWKGIGKVFALALVLDVVYQVVVLHFVYIGEAILVAIVLALLPYLVLRGLVNRLWRKS